MNKIPFILPIHLESVHLYQLLHEEQSLSEHTDWIQNINQGGVIINEQLHYKGYNKAKNKECELPFNYVRVVFEHGVNEVAHFNLVVDWWAKCLVDGQQQRAQTKGRVLTIFLVDLPIVFLYNVEPWFLFVKDFTKFRL